jgi:release factor glutamine methyltransferase
MIYEPQEDSYLLEKHVKKLAKGKVLDMGTGSGILAKAAKGLNLEVLAVDINPEAIAKCQEQGLEAIESDLFSNIKDKFDTIIFNPPYLPDAEGEPEDSKLITTGGKYGHELLERFLIESKGHLNENGIILLVFSSHTGNMEKIFDEQKYDFTLLGQESHFFEKLLVYQITLQK